MNVLYKYVKVYAWKMNIKRDIVVQKMKNEKSISRPPRFVTSLQFFIQLISSDLLSFDYLMLYNKLEYILS